MFLYTTFEIIFFNFISNSDLRFSLPLTMLVSHPSLVVPSWSQVTVGTLSPIWDTLQVRDTDDPSFSYRIDVLNSSISRNGGGHFQLTLTKIIEFRNRKSKHFSTKLTQHVKGEVRLKLSVDLVGHIARVPSVHLRCYLGDNQGGGVHSVYWLFSCHRVLTSA